jgi:hypothetical protein
MVFGKMEFRLKRAEQVFVLMSIGLLEDLSIPNFGVRPSGFILN